MNNENQDVFNSMRDSFDVQMEKLVWSYGEEEEDAPSIHPYSRRSFLFHPSFLDTYLDLKQIDPALAEEYIEKLMHYGVDDVKVETDKPIIRIALSGPVATIDKAFCNYLVRQSTDRREKEKQRQQEKEKRMEEQRKLKEERKNRYAVGE